MLFSNTSEISYLLFLNVNPNAKCCPTFNLTSMINFTVLPLFNLIKMLFSNTSKISYLLFFNGNPDAKCCPTFNLTSMINFTVLPQFN